MVESERLWHLHLVPLHLKSGGNELVLILLGGPGAKPRNDADVKTGQPTSNNVLKIIPQRSSPKPNQI